MSIKGFFFKPAKGAKDTGAMNELHQSDTYMGVGKAEVVLQQTRAGMKGYIGHLRERKSKKKLNPFKLFDTK